MKNERTKKIGIGSIFAVASVWFGSHAGGGFATGNQATQYFNQYGWFAPFMAVIAMGILALVLRECLIMTNNHGFTNYKQVFEELWSPHKKMAVLFDIFNYVVAFSATGAAIAGAATLFTSFGISYAVAALGISILLFFLTIFGANLVTKASTIMSVCILICCAIIFFVGIKAKSLEITTIMSQQQVYASPLQAILKTLNYAGFQALCAPALISCACVLKTSKNASKACFVGFLMNAFALGLSCVMLMGWYGSYVGTENAALPTLYICSQLGMPFLSYCYSISLFLCFISTGVTCVFGFVPRFENNPMLSNKIKNINIRRGSISFAALIISTLVSMAGLTNIIKYAYVGSGYLSLFVVVIPMLTIGHYKNKKFAQKRKEKVKKQTELKPISEN